MVNIEDIPVEERWKIAAKSAGFMPLLYDKFFREALGDKYDEIERPILVEVGKEMKDLAMALGLPSGNARQLVETIGVISMISWTRKQDGTCCGNRVWCDGEVDRVCGKKQCDTDGA